ncbi:MAG: GMC family oxidoreductase N-terminal domain-containing protein, partial [Actinobacteria bacterium]|nr:GMC family oxidoreductase N-terminal domain-containing protein [Actinomycetota bacterium]
RMHELWHGELDWNFQTVPQPAEHGRRLHLPRGRVVGGSHALNAMVWVRGNPVDYDTWAYLGNPGWAWADVEPVFAALEDRDGAGPGPQPVLTDYRPDEIHASIVAAAVAAGVPFNPDYNSGRQDGVSFMQLTIRDGARVMTADAYLDLPSGDRLSGDRPSGDRPEVRAGCLVDRLLVRGGRCHGVRYLRDGETVDVTAERVVLTAGALGSPAILERSGIGDPAVLRAAGVEVQVGLPGVGANLQDHCLVPVLFSTVRPPQTSPGLPTTQSHLFWRSDAALPTPDVEPILFAAPLLADWMLGPAQGFSLMAGLVRPASRGTVHLAAANPTIPPLVDPAVLSATSDVDTLVAAVRLCREIGRQAPLADAWGAEEIYPASFADGEQSLHDYVRETVVTYHHQAGTCALGPVVDPRLRVHGVSGLLVADASVMPTIVTGNTNAPVAMIAERAAEFVLKD